MAATARLIRAMLAELKPLVRNACKIIDANLADIRALRESADQRDVQAARRARGELTRDELATVADRMQLIPTPRAARRRRRTRP